MVPLVKIALLRTCSLYAVLTKYEYLVVRTALYGSSSILSQQRCRFPTMMFPQSLSISFGIFSAVRYVQRSSTSRISSLTFVPSYLCAFVSPFHFYSQSLLVVTSRVFLAGPIAAVSHP